MNTELLAVVTTGAITLVIAIIGTIMTWERERVRRYEENFTSIIKNFTSDKKIIQCGAAISILSFLKPKFKDYHYQVYLMLLSALKLKWSDSTHRVLIKCFEEAINTHIKNLENKYINLASHCFRKINLHKQLKTTEKKVIDLARSDLRRIKLSNFVLAHVDIGFSDLSQATLTNTNFFKAKGIKVKFEGANLEGAVLIEGRFKYAKCAMANFSKAKMMTVCLEEADLRGARFCGAKLQCAHFHKAKLAGANFVGADISNAYFLDASFDDIALQSMLKNNSWRNNAIFSPDTKDRLNYLSKVSNK